MSRKKKNKSQINSYLLLCILILSVIVTLFFGFNIVRIGLKQGGGSGTTVDKGSGASMKNDLYAIGNNPTNIQKEYFKELTESLKGDDKLKIAEAVVKSFVTDYFTWTNKDGNYEVGGLQYIFGSKYVAFENESRWTFYKDLDLYISQFGRENLLEVEKVTITFIDYAADFVTSDRAYTSYYVEAEWTYKPSSKIDVNEFQNVGYFTVSDNDGRYEITQILNNQN